MRTLNPDLCLPASPSSSTINATLTALNFVSVYIEFSLYSGDSLLFPNIGSFILAVAAAIHNRRLIEFDQVLCLLAISAFTLTTTAIAILVWSVEPIENLMSLAQMIVSLFTAYGIFLAMIGMTRRQITYLFGAILLLLLVGALMERTEAVRATSDYVRNLIYSRDVLYLAERRDLVQYGAIRPNFFAREPSLVGVSIGLAMVLALIAAPRLKQASRFVLMLAITALTVWIVRSPTILFFTAIVALAPLTLPNAQGNRPALAQPVFLGAVAVIVFAGPIAFYLWEDTRGPISDFLYSGSFYLRMVGPPSAAAAVVEQSPIVGVGVGGYDTALGLIREVYAAQGAFTYHPYLLAEMDARYLVSNAFWELPMFFGVAGIGVMIYLLHRLFLALGLRSTIFPFLAIAYASQTLGGASAFRLWFFLFCFGALGRIIESTAQVHEHTGNATPMQSLRRRVP